MLATASVHDDTPGQPSPHLESSLSTCTSTSDGDYQCDGDLIDPTTTFFKDGCFAGGFHGRQKELRTMRHVFYRVMAQNGGGKAPDGGEVLKLTSPATPPCDVNKSDAEPWVPAVFVWGASGTGKSKLVDAFCSQLCEQSGDGHKIIIIKGKFEESQRNNPFAAITQAFSAWCAELESQAATLTVGSGRLAAISDADGHKDSKSKTATELQRLRRRVKSSWMTSQQKDLLISFIPALSILLNSASDVAAEAKNEGVTAPKPLTDFSTETSWNRLQYTFTQFLRIISSKECPLVMVLDDLQWASQESMDLVSTMLHRPHLLLIGTIRQETNPHSPDELLEPNVALPFMKLLNDIRQSWSREDVPTELKAKMRNAPMPYTSIQLSDFSPQELYDWVSNLLQLGGADHSDHGAFVGRLTENLYQQTGGNIFHAMHLLREMERTHGLAYDAISSQWKFQDDSHSNTSGNGGLMATGPHGITYLLTSRIRSLPRPLQKLLALASYIGSSFDSGLLQMLQDYEVRYNRGTEDILGNDESNLRSSPNIPDDDIPVVEWLEQAVLESMLHNSIGGTTYSFAHDRVQQAARSLVPFGEIRIKLQLRIGQCLWNICAASTDGTQSSEKGDGAALATSRTATDDGALLFVAMEYLNLARTKDHLQAAKQNLEVGEHALKIAALIPAAKYLQIATEQLKKAHGNPWKYQYELTLRLIRSRADLELAVGNFELGFSLSDELLQHAQCISHKLATYHSMADALARQDKHKRALEMSQASAQLCNVYPKRGFLARSVWQLMSARSYFGQTSDDEFFSRCPVTTDPATIQSIGFLQQIAVRSYVCQSTLTWVLSTVQMVQITRAQGICEGSCQGLAMFAMLHLVLGEYSNARRYIELAKKAIHKVDGTRIRALVYNVAAIYIDPYTKEPAEISSDFQEAHKAAMSSGDFEVGIVSHFSSLIYAYMEGYPLDGLSSAVDSALQQFTIYKIKAHSKLMPEYVLAPRYMAGILKLDWDELGNLKQFEGGDPYLQNTAHWSRLHLAVFFRKFEFAEVLFHLVDNAKVSDLADSVASSIPQLGGLMASNRYHQTKQRKYISILRKQKQILKQMCETKGNNVRHHYLLLRAEMKAIKMGPRTPTYVQACYDEAIEKARSRNHIHEAGLACEMAGEAFLRISTHDVRDRTSNLIRHYFTRAAEFYEAWGAVTKCEDLRQRRGDHIDEDLVRHARKSDGVIAQTVALMDPQRLDACFDLVTVRTPEATVVPTVTSTGLRSDGLKSRARQREKSYAIHETVEGHANGDDDDDDLSVLTDMS